MTDSMQPDPALTSEERALGMDRTITRRDFVNAMAAGTGTALLGGVAPGLVHPAGAAVPSASTQSWDPWTGYGGVGDYATSNGNTWAVVNAGHGIRDREYERLLGGATSTGENYDLVIVGGGFSGTIAAYTFLKRTNRERSCLMLDNHPLIGGEAKRNEFFVRGHRLIGPQGSNACGVPIDSWRSELWDDIGLPRQFEWGQLKAGRRAMEFPRTNYDYQLWYFDPSQAKGVNHGHFFDTPRPHWVTNPWGQNLEGTPWPAGLRRDLLRWRDDRVPAFHGDQASLERWLDTMTYDEYLTNYRKLHPDVARHIDPLLVSGLGPASDASSAYLPYFTGFPGFAGLGEPMPALTRARSDAYPKPNTAISFPGGNDGILRAIIKWLNPAVIEGSSAYADVHNGRVRFEAMDDPQAPCRMRPGATVARVVHDPESNKKPVTIVYFKDNKLYSVQARTVIWAGSSWTGQHVVQNLPPDYRTAMGSFPRSPMLVVNIALNNWRALYKLGYTSCSWDSGFGCTGNMRAPMYVGGYRPPLDPDQPTLFTLYVPFPQPGVPRTEQGRVARAKLYATSYRDFELQIRQQMVKLFGGAGFDPKHDVAGIVLNRWGHAYVNAGPGFFFGRDGKPAPRDILRQPLGNVIFAHSELAGLQLWDWAGEEGIRGATQALEML